MKIFIENEISIDLIGINIDEILELKEYFKSISVQYNIEGDICTIVNQKCTLDESTGCQLVDFLIHYKNIESTYFEDCVKVYF